MKKVLLKDLEKFCVEALVKSGLTEENAKIVADVLITTDTFGVLPHGTKNLYQYIQKMHSGGRRLVFLIGGPYGFSPRIYEQAQGMVSLSQMTFSHQMVRLFLVEQLYRACTILKGEPYHHD